jgi:DNA-directed RNA polymerase subunit RPC12/RpoP
MNIPLQFNCASCGELNTHRIHLDQSSFDWTCKKCGHLHPSFLSLDFTIGPKLLQRSLFELKIEKDYSMSIVFSATALDSELSRLFFKWKSIADGLSGLTFDEEACEKELVKFHNLVNKMTGVTELLHPGGGIDAFVSSSAEFTDALNRFPSLNHGSLAADFHKRVFKPRNKILHQGMATFTETDANKVYSIADLGLRMLLAMDIQKRATIP